MRVLRSWVGLALLAPMLVLAVSASSFIGVRCRMTGMVSVATCCPDGEVPPAPAQSTVDEPGCCERIVVETAKPIANTGGDGAGAVASPPSVPVVVVALVDPVPGPRLVRAPLDGAPPGVSRTPVRLLKQSLLI